MEVKRVLHIINGIGTGGAEKDIINWYRNIDRNRIQFDFLIRSNQEFYKDEIEKMGGHVYKVAPFPHKLIKNLFQTIVFLFTHREYEMIHVHGNALIYIYPLMIAKWLRNPVRIIHVHSTKANGKLASIFHRINKLFIYKYANKLVACSYEAGRFAYGKKNFLVINNAIDMQRYKIDGKDIKQEFDLFGDYFIIGHIGRFLPVKNQRFVVDVFYEIVNKRPKAKLLLIGSGPQKEKIIDYVKKYNLSDKVLFLGERKDIEKILDIINIIILPSLYEGVPLVALEAQASGTRIIYSNVIDSQVKITPYAKEMSLKKSPKQWAKATLSFINESIECDIDKEFEKAGYTIDTVIEILYTLYGGE